jgi:hypothetical protein
LESNEIIIGSYIRRTNPIAKFLFNAENTDWLYSYHSIHLNSNGGVSVRKINTINQYWRLEQVLGQ